MGEISFRYMRKFTPVYETPFKYWYTDSIKYSLDYQRYVASSDTSLFNDPVAISKVATGFYNLRDLFVDKVAHPIIIESQPIGYDKKQKPMFIVKDYMLSTDGNVLSLYDAYLAITPEDKSLEVYKTISLKGERKDLNRITQYGLTSNTKDLNIYDYYGLSVNDKKLNIFCTTCLSPHVKDLNIYEAYSNLAKYNLLNILPDISGMYKNGNSDLVYYSEMYRINRYNNLEIRDSGLLAWYDKSKLNIYENLSGKTDNNKIVNILWSGTAWTDGKNLNKYNNYQTVSGKFKDNYLDINIFKLLSWKRPNITANVFYQYFGDMVFSNRMEIYQNFYAKPYGKTVSFVNNTLPIKISDKIVDLNDIYNAYVSDKTARLYSIYSGTVPNKDITTNHSVSGILANASRQISVYDVLQGKVSNKDIDIQNSVFGIKNDKTMITNQSVSIDFIESNSVITDKIYGVTKDDKPAYIFDFDTFSVMESKYVFTTNGTWSINDLKDLMTNTGVWSSLSSKPVFETSGVFADIEKKDLMTNTDVSLTKEKIDFSFSQSGVFSSKQVLDIFTTTGVFADMYSKNIFTTNILFLCGLRKPVSVDDSYTWLKKSRISFALLENSGTFIYKCRKPIWLCDNAFAYKVSKEMSIIDDGGYGGVYAEFIKKDMSILDQSISDVYREPKEMSILNDSTSALKALKEFTVYDSTVFAYKDSHEISVSDTSVSAAKKYFDLPLANKDIWAIKSSHGIYMTNQVFADRDDRMASIYNTARFILKQYVSVDLPDIDFVLRNNIPVDLVNGVADQFGGMIIPISKVRKQAYIDSIDEMASKVFKDSFITDQAFCSVFPKELHIDLGLFCDKDAHKVYINYRNLGLMKYEIHGTINGGPVYNEGGMNNGVFVSKIPGNAFTTPHPFVSKVLKKAWIENTDWAVKSYHKAYIGHGVFANSIPREAYLDKSLFVDKTNKMCYYDYGTLFADKTKIQAMIDRNLWALTNTKEAMLADCIPDVVKKNVSVFYEYGVFANTLIKQSQLYQQIEGLNGFAKDLDIMPNDFGNWAWVYETPDPLDIEYGIDELLLPENDTRYSDFENIIFNKETMKPRRPVKVLSDTKFIAKYPNKHPLPEYSDIAVNYDDSAVKWQQYYGIETSIMSTVFLKYYRIWQSKIFEFSMMTMVQSVKKMLEYLYSWIMSYFPVDQLEQALRVFKLIRWYGESAIIQNSQYIVSYEYATLESKLNGGTCQIPNDMDPITNDTMIVDSALGVIKVNPIYVSPSGGSSDVHVTFYIDAHKNTSITFSLSNTIGSVNIYINDVLVDVISKTTLNLTYQIPYTGDVNTVTIEKLKGHNLNKNFYIGNIKVPELTFKDLSIEFDPTLKAGNKPLDVIAKKMTQYATWYDDIQDAYKHVRQGNLGVQETYKKMIEYWNLHHKDKTKGKRLTIKEV